MDLKKKKKVILVVLIRLFSEVGMEPVTFSRGGSYATHFKKHFS